MRVQLKNRPDRTLSRLFRSIAAALVAADCAAGVGPIGAYDLDGDGWISGADVAALLDQMGGARDPRFVSGDLDGDGTIGSADLEAMLRLVGQTGWGAKIAPAHEIWLPHNGAWWIASELPAGERGDLCGGWCQNWDGSWSPCVGYCGGGGGGGGGGNPGTGDPPGGTGGTGIIGDGGDGENPGGGGEPPEPGTPSCAFEVVGPSPVLLMPWTGDALASFSIEIPDAPEERGAAPDGISWTVVEGSDLTDPDEGGDGGFVTTVSGPGMVRVVVERTVNGETCVRTVAFVAARMRLQSMTFENVGLSNYCRIFNELRRTGQAPWFEEFTGPHWEHEIAEEPPSPPQPAVFTRLQTVDIASVIFELDSGGASMHPGRIQGEGEGLLWEGSLLRAADPENPSAWVMQATSLHSTAQLPNVVRQYKPFEINWSVTFEEAPVDTPPNWEPTWTPMGTTASPVYVVYSAPSQSGLRLESFYDIATRTTVWNPSPESVLDTIWAEFADRQVQNARGELMAYYQGALCANDCSVFRAAALVIELNGQCYSWVELLMECLRTQAQNFGDQRAMSIEANRTIVPAACSGDDVGMLVRSFSFTDTPSSQCSSYPFTLNDPCLPLDPFIWPNGSEAIDLLGMPGQSNANPASFFIRHFVVRIWGRYYDPSYGGIRRESQFEWEEASLAGFWGGVTPIRLGARKKTLGVQETGFVESPDRDNIANEPW